MVNWIQQNVTLYCTPPEPFPPFFLFSPQCCEMTSDKTPQMWWWQQESRQSLSAFLPEAIPNPPSTGRKTKCELTTRMTGSQWVLLPSVLIPALNGKNYCQYLLWFFFYCVGHIGGKGLRDQFFLTAHLKCADRGEKVERERSILSLYLHETVLFSSDPRGEADDLQHEKEWRWHVHLCGNQHGRREGQRDSTSHRVW